jgi:hypothetical protein
MDEDLDRMSREQLIDEVKKLRQGIRGHRDSTRLELCWHHLALWGLLPEKMSRRCSFAYFRRQRSAGNTSCDEAGRLR